MDEPRAIRRARPHDYSAVRLLQKVAVIANEAETFPDAISATLKEVCGYTAWPVGHAYALDPIDPSLLRSSGLWRLPDRRAYATLVEITERTRLRRGIGLPGRVLQTGKPAWSHDITTDDNFPRAHTGRDLAVRGAFAVPVLAKKKVVAVLEFFSDHPEPCDDLLLELVGYVGTQLGRIAERERSASALVAQVEQTAKLIESAFDAFIAIDERGRVTSWNHAAEVMFGWERDEVIGRLLTTRVIPARYRDAHEQGVVRFFATGVSDTLNQRRELTAIRKNGEEFPVEVAVWPVEQNGRTTFCGLVHDITDRRAQEHERELAVQLVRTSEQRLAAAQEMAAVGSWDWDIENNIVHWSDQLYRNFGVTSEEFPPSFESYMDLVHPEDRTFVGATIAQALDDLGSFDFEHRVIRPSDGAVRIHQCQGRVIAVDGRAMSMAGTSQDITERKSTEDALQEAVQSERDMVKRLEQLDVARSDFVSAVSHELRTPLTSIIGYLQLVMDMGHEITDEHIGMLDIVDRNSQKLLGLIEDLLTKSRIDSGRFRLNLTQTDVGHLVSTAVKAMLPTAGGIKINADVPDGLEPIEADAGQVERILLNLLSNAIKFTVAGEVNVRVMRESDSVIVSVTDTGIGIEPEDLAQLFTPYFRTPAAERTAPGTGLGLVLVKDIVEAHGGTISVSSAPGQGTTVVVRLPAVAASDEETPAA